MRLGDDGDAGETETLRLRLEFADVLKHLLQRRSARDEQLQQPVAAPPDHIIALGKHRFDRVTGPLRRFEQDRQSRVFERIGACQADIEPVEAELSGQVQKLIRRVEVELAQVFGVEREPAHFAVRKRRGQFAAALRQCRGVGAGRGVDDAFPRPGTRAAGRKQGAKYRKSENFQKKHRFPPIMPLK